MTGQWVWINHDGRELVFVPKGAAILGPSTDSLSRLPAASDDSPSHTGANGGVEGGNVVDAGNESGNAEA